MAVTTGFKWAGGSLIVFNVLFIVFTFVYIALFLSHFQFWRLEMLIFQNDVFKLFLCLKIQCFVNLMCSLFNNYALNVASKFLLKTTAILMTAGVISTLISLLVLIYSYSENYPYSIKTSYHYNIEIMTFINSRYSNLPYDNINSRVQQCIAEMDGVVFHAKVFLSISMGVLIATYTFTKLISCLKISKKPRQQPNFTNIQRAAMGTGSLKNTKVVIH